ncbi:hypothetical protein C0993_006813, partial [Termitomyces sp. T159_Od127]
NIYVHRLLDAHLVTFVLDKSILKMVEEKLRVNSSVKTATEGRQRILTDLDKEMPDGGWPVTLLATNICDKTEAIMVHDLVQDLKGCLRTAETYQVFKHPFAIPFNTAASPIFILANMWEQRTKLGLDVSWYRENWKAEQFDQFDTGTLLIERLLFEADVPEDFKKRAARDTRESRRGETVLGLPQDKYDYYVGKYEAETSAAVVTKSNSDDAKNEYHSDTEEESELDGQEPLKNLSVLSSLQQKNFRDIEYHGVHFLSRLFRPTQPPESVANDADDEIVDDPFSEVGSRSAYVDDETASGIGSRNSPLQPRSRTYNVNMLTDRFRYL